MDDTDETAANRLKREENVLFEDGRRVADDTYSTVIINDSQLQRSDLIDLMMNRTII